MTLKELRDRRAAIQAEGQELAARVREAGEAATDDDKNKIAALREQLAQVDQEIKDAELLLDAERDFGSVGGAPREREQLMDDPNHCGFANLAEFAVAVRHAALGQTIDPRLAAVRQLEASQRAQQAAVLGQPQNFHRETMSDEGYMVPPALRDGIWELVFEEEGIITLVDLEPTDRNSVGMLKDETTPWGSSGVQAYWAAEAEKMNPSKLETGMVQVPLHKLYAFVAATDELLEDAPRMNDRLSRKSAQAISWKADDAIIWGDGVGKPRGWMESPAKIVQPKESSQEANTIKIENVGKMYERMLPGSIRRSLWFANTNIFTQLLTMTVGGSPAFQPINQPLTSGPAGFLVGRPLRWSEHAHTLGTEGDLQFVDPMGYYAARRTNAPQFASSIHLWFDFGVQAFRWTIRLGGQGYMSKPRQPARGANTQSTFVTLQTRS